MWEYWLGVSQNLVASGIAITWHWFRVKKLMIKHHEEMKKGKG